MKCVHCDREYEYRPRYHTKTQCHNCLVNRRRFEVKRKAVEYKGGKCQVCGYDRCMDAMSFHHIDPATKDFTISGNHSRAFATIKAELDKCVLLCVRCHAEVHARLVVLPA